jgi:polysaccharide export outer membrane protein
MSTQDASRRLALLMLTAGLAAACAGTRESGVQGELDAADYRLGAGDQLRITVFGETELTGQYVVSSGGTIAFPLLGEVQAGGMTLAELSSSLREKLQGGFVRNPNLAVEVMNYRPYYILGEVRTPGTYPYVANLTVLNAVATSQGFTTRANQDVVFIKHANESVETRYRLTTTTPVQPGDTIRIGERLF